MKIFFSCPVEGLKSYKNQYLDIINVIKKLGHELTTDWVKNAIEKLNFSKKFSLLEEDYLEIIQSIMTSDVVILDATISTMEVGQQLSRAVDKKKPVLVLQHIENGEESHQIYIEDKDRTFVNVEQYHDEKDLNRIILKFLQKYEPSSKTRFNLVLNKSQDRYIEWAAYTYNKSKTEIIQTAIDKVMDGDIDYGEKSE